MPDVIPGLTSIIIPTYQHAPVLGAAIESALRQTARCEVIVIDDGSTDDTEAVAHAYAVRYMRQEHAGPSAARNRGIEAASGEFLMLLDADDTIAPAKVAEQFAAFTDDVGWVLCDVCIEDAAAKRTMLASERYDYAGKQLGGWIQSLLTEGNFIPIMSPLIRRSALGAIRFDDDKIPEDWHFWHELAGVARVRYLPRVLATYRKSKTGRSRIPLKARKIDRNVTLPLRLNLGCGTKGTRSWHPIAGMVNLDKSMGWTFEDGLGEFVTGSISGITVSHSLMYVRDADWPRVFREFARVLEPGGVIRITEDDSLNQESSRYGGWKGSEPAVVLMDASKVLAALKTAGLAACEVGASETHYADRSLCQQQHGNPPDVFFVEGVKQVKVLFSPHSDDEALFAAFTILRHRPRVVVCFGSTADYGDDATRGQETRDAMQVLGGDPVELWHLPPVVLAGQQHSDADLVTLMVDLDASFRPDVVFAPSPSCSHPDHATVARAAATVFGDRVVRYHTYDAGGKVRSGQEVEFEPEWVEHKLRALARYVSQIRHPRACQFFVQDLREYGE